jgi:hypothetical protein
MVDVLDNDNETLINYTYVYSFLTAPVIGQFSDKAYASTAEVLIAVQTDCTYVGTSCMDRSGYKYDYGRWSFLFY